MSSSCVPGNVLCNTLSKCLAKPDSTPMLINRVKEVGIKSEIKKKKKDKCDKRNEEKVLGSFVIKARDNPKVAVIGYTERDVRADRLEGDGF